MTKRTVNSIIYRDDTHFIVNTHALHNASLLRQFLPRHLTVPQPLFADRKKRHEDLAVDLAKEQTAKCMATKAKAAAT